MAKKVIPDDGFVEVKTTTKTKWEVMTDEQIDKYRFEFVRNTLRKASYRWPWRGIVVKNSRVDRGVYVCAKCGDRIGSKDFNVDHVLPVVRVDRGFVTWGEYILNMFPNARGWQVLCTECHDKKTGRENEQRREAKRNKV